MRCLLCLVAFFLFIGCQAKLEPEPAYPYTHIHRLAVCPVLLQPDYDEQHQAISLDSELLGRILAEEWTKFNHEKGLAIIFPRETLAVINDQKIAPDSPGNLRKIARLLKADSICLVQLNHYQPYSPKSCTLTFQLYATDSDDFETQRIVNISQLGANLEPETDFVELASIQRRWDGHDQKLRDRAQAWANRQELDSVTTWENVFKIESHYFRFIFNTTIRDYVNELNQKIKEAEDLKEKIKKDQKTKQDTPSDKPPSSSTLVGQN